MAGMRSHNAEWMIALDFDGTCARYEPRLEIDPVLITFLLSLQTSQVKWVINSDRSADSLQEVAGLLEPRDRPASVLSCQRFIHMLVGDSGYQPLREWNDSQQERHNVLWRKIRPYFSRWEQAIAQQFSVLECIVNEFVFACRVPEGQARGLRACMHTLVRDWQDAQVSGNNEWAFILHAGFSKARVLKKCAGLLGVVPENIIAVGDGFNDVTMLDGSITSMVGCPVNAAPEVVLAVNAAGGMVADQPHAAGTVQVLQHYWRHRERLRAPAPANVSTGGG